MTKETTEMPELPTPSRYDPFTGSSSFSRAQVHNIQRQAFEAGRKAAGEDAERYRAMRDPALHERNPGFSSTNFETSEELDAAIDAARKAKP